MRFASPSNGTEHPKRYLFADREACCCTGVTSSAPAGQADVSGGEGRTEDGEGRTGSELVAARSAARFALHCTITSNK